MRLGHKLALANRRCAEPFVPFRLTRSRQVARDESLRSVVAELLRPRATVVHGSPRKKPLASSRILLPLSVSRADRTTIGSGCYVRPPLPGAE